MSVIHHQFTATIRIVVKRGQNRDSVIGALLLQCCRLVFFCIIKSNLVAICWKELGLIVQSMVSLTSLLRGQLVKCFTTL